MLDHPPAADGTGSKKKKKKEERKTGSYNQK
jgi:hypothetical protein